MADERKPWQFQPGNKLAKGGARLGGGRKPDEWKRMFNAALKAAIDTEDLKDLLLSLASRGKAGDTKAAALLLAYVVGKPAETINLKQSGKLTHEHIDADEDAIIAAAEEIRFRRLLGNAGAEEPAGVHAGDVSEL